MWRDTSRFVRCARRNLQFPGPVHEYGLAATVTVPPGDDDRISSPSIKSGEAIRSEARFESLDDLAKLPYPDGSVGTIACLNVLQHVADPGAVAEEMIRLLAPGGILLLCSCTAGRGVANVDLLWRPAPHAFQRLLTPLDATLIGWQGREGDPHSIYALGCKAPVTANYLAGVNKFLTDFRAELARQRQGVTWLEKFRDWLARLSGRPTSPRMRAGYYDCQFVMHSPIDGKICHKLLADSIQPSTTGSRLDTIQ